MDFLFSLGSEDDHIGMRSTCNLSLTRCDLRLPADVAAMNLISLRKAYLDQIEMTEEMVRDFILGCPNLEDLSLKDCYGMENLKICSKKLRRLALGHFYDMDERNTVEIDCPNLLCLEFDCCDFTQFSLKNASNLWHKVVKLLEQAPHVKHLNVQNWWFKFLISKDPFLKSFKLQNVRLLKLPQEAEIIDGLAKTILNPPIKLIKPN